MEGIKQKIPYVDIGGQFAGPMKEEIMEAVEEPVQMTRCSLENVGGCVAGHRCLTHGLWQDLGLHIKSFLRQTSLADVISSTAEFIETVKVFEATSDEASTSSKSVSLKEEQV